jgi:hypothetical protein
MGRSLPEPKAVETIPASIIVSNSGDKVLLDLARNLQPSESGPCVLPLFERCLRRRCGYLRIPSLPMTSR